LPVHEIKALGGFGRADKGEFDRALTALQGNLYITMRGREQKLSRTGEGYGWASAVFMQTEAFWPPEVFETASRISKREAYEKIAARVLSLNPSANQKKLKKFIEG
jgi:hypothetical protein